MGNELKRAIWLLPILIIVVLALALVPGLYETARSLVSDRPWVPVNNLAALITIVLFVSLIVAAIVKVMSTTVGAIVRAFKREQRSSATIGQDQEPAATSEVGRGSRGISEANRTRSEGIQVNVQDDSGQPVARAKVLLGLENGTYHYAATDENGICEPPLPNRWPIRVLCAHEGFKAYNQLQHEPQRTLQVTLLRANATGSIICRDGTGYVPGLEGRLNPILDSINRTYLYADNIAIDEGKQQPVHFELGEPLVAEDRYGQRFQLKVLAFVGRTSIVEYVSLGPVEATETNEVVGDDTLEVIMKKFLREKMNKSVKQGIHVRKSEIEAVGLDNRYGSDDSVSVFENLKDAYWYGEYIESNERGWIGAWISKVG